MSSRHKEALVQRPWGEPLLTTVSLCVWLESRSVGAGGEPGKDWAEDALDRS